ncbi:glycosyltransferase family A protein [Kordia algicida OT-1]|uniref:Possible glycosyltransferase n=1 Tax=Kordia algicida OT-1 TaxID=391587 RepID=A9DYH1_9FLAO|nr:glycosyltransferase family A protein [Kordia algicida]EDP96132.1 Possible glycosyltransferase [Kordia algicida OT-1]
MKLKNKISFCTVSMNRLYHLKETLVRNIEDNIDYENIEFVLLDYNSNDDIKSWVTNDLKVYLDMGILKFYSTNIPETFHRSHSRNVVMKLATGDIICNLDADNYLGKDFAYFINYQFSFSGNIFLTSAFADGSTGRVCVKKDDFLAVKGYDERMSGWGFEDDDLYNRLTMSGLKNVKFNNSEFVEFIWHDVEESFENDINVTGVSAMYIQHKSSFQSTLLFLFQDGKFKYGNIEKPKAEEDAVNTELVEDTWQTGTFTKQNNAHISLTFTNDITKKIHIATTEATKNTVTQDAFIRVTDSIFKGRLLLLLTSLENKKLYKNKFASLQTAPNPENWGETIIQNLSKSLQSC